VGQQQAPVLPDVPMDYLFFIVGAAAVAAPGTSGALGFLLTLMLWIGAVLLIAVRQQLTG
jgi:hypothetical protein